MSENENNREKYMQKIEALLAKAASSKFPQEAQSFTAKAFELMNRYAIDEAELFLRQPDKGKIIEQRFVISGSGYMLNERMYLLNSLSNLNRCKLLRMFGVENKPENFPHVFGYESDVYFVQLLFTNISVQMEAFLNEAARNDAALSRWAEVAKSWGTKEDKAEYTKRRAKFRESFMSGFRVGILHRLENDENRQAVVLVSRADDVSEYIADRFGELTKSKARRRSYNSTAFGAGQEAAKRANLSMGASDVNTANNAGLER